MMTSHEKWNKRSADKVQQIDIKKRYWFVCEGRNTEVSYIRCLNNRRKDIGINALIELCPYKKQGADKGITDPKSLVKYTERLCKDGKFEDFDDMHDKIVVVFDADVFQRDNNTAEFENVRMEGEQKGFLLGISNPCFELFLLLHYPRSYEESIKQDEVNILKNDKVSGQKRYVQDVLARYQKTNSKTKAIGNLASNVKVAIEQEKNLNQDNRQCIGNLTSNIGTIIERIIKESPDIESLPIRSAKVQL